MKGKKSMDWDNWEDQLTESCHLGPPNKIKENGTKENVGKWFYFWMKKKKEKKDIITQRMFFFNFFFVLFCYYFLNKAIKLLKKKWNLTWGI